MATNNATAKDADGKVIRIGDRVEFKRDMEQSGKVVKIYTAWPNIGHIDVDTGEGIVNVDASWKCWKV